MSMRQCLLPVADYYSLRLNPAGVSYSLNEDRILPVAGILQIYLNGKWGDVTYSGFTDADQEFMLLTYTADCKCYSDVI